MSEHSPEDEAELAEELVEALRQLKIEDVLVQTLVTISSIGYRRLGLTPDTEADRDLEQARLAIETMNAITPVLERFVPDQLIQDFRQSLANLQLAYAKAAGESGAAPEDAEA